MNRKNLVIVLMALTMLSAKFALAQEKSNDKDGASVFRAEFMTQLDDVQKKILDLAEAMPEEKYSWRPMEGVRSVGEVYVHIAGGNYLLPSYAGVKPDKEPDRDAEKKITAKKDVVDFLKQSFEFLRGAIAKTSDADLGKPTKMFGQETTYLGVYLHAATHLHEHLGQSIAYARMNKIVPPWTAAEQAKQKQADTGK